MIEHIFKLNMVLIFFGLPFFGDAPFFIGFLAWSLLFWFVLVPFGCLMLGGLSIAVSWLRSALRPFQNG